MERQIDKNNFFNYFRIYIKNSDKYFIDNMLNIHNSLIDVTIKKIYFQTNKKRVNICGS